MSSIQDKLQVIFQRSESALGLPNSCIEGMMLLTLSWQFWYKRYLWCLTLEGYVAMTKYYWIRGEHVSYSMPLRLGNC